MPGIILAVFLVGVLFEPISHAASVRSRIVEVFSGTTFRASDGAVIRAVYVDSDKSIRDIICDEPCGTTIAKDVLLNQRITYSREGIDYAGTLMARIQVNGVPYENILCGSCNCSSTDPFISADTSPVLGEISVNDQIATTTDSTECDKSEAFWQHAFNEQYAKGATEVVVTAGRADIVNEEFAFEVDRIQKWHEAIGQAKHYAARTTRKPAIALFDDGQGDYTKQLTEARWLAEREGIDVFVINDYIACDYSLRNPPPYLQSTPQEYGLKSRITSFAVPASWLGSSPMQHPPGGSSKSIQTGPRGGRFYITDGGTKRYVSQD